MIEEVEEEDTKKEKKKKKESDPSFYKFLLENDKQLLDFRELEREDGEEGEEEAEDVAAPEPIGESAARVMTPARFQRIQDSAASSFTAFKASLSLYHTAVRSIEGGAEAKEEEAAGDDA